MVEQMELALIPIEKQKLPDLFTQRLQRFIRMRKTATGEENIMLISKAIFSTYLDLKLLGEETRATSIISEGIKTNVSH